MPIPPGGYSRAEFLTVHGYSEQMFKSLKARGLAPKETLLPDSKYSRITEKDYLAWLDLISKPDCQIKEFERRRKFYRANGLAAAQAPGHPAQVWKRFRKLNLADKPVPPKRPRKQVEAAE